MNNLDEAVYLEGPFIEIGGTYETPNYHKWSIKWSST